MRTDNAETDTQHRLGRQQTRKVEKWRAIQRLVGSWILGIVAVWKILMHEAAVEAGGVPWILLMWIGLALLAFGLASWDQILKAVKR